MVPNYGSIWVETWQPCKSPDVSHGYPKSEGLTLATPLRPRPYLNLLSVACGVIFVWARMTQEDVGLTNWLGGVALVKDIEDHQGFSRCQPIFCIYFCCLYNCFHFIAYKNVIHHHYI